MTYHRPQKLDQALKLRARGETGIIAGGTDLFPAQSGRELVGDFIDITAIAELTGIAKEDDGWRIGAATSWNEIANADLPPAFDALKQAAKEVGAIQIQNSGTIAGNLCNASPAADGVPPLLVLDAEVELCSEAGRRKLPLADFVLHVRKTDLRPDEILTAVFFPNAAGTGCSAFSKLGSREYLVISIAMVAVHLQMRNDVIERAKIAVGSCSPVARRLEDLEAELVGKPVSRPQAWRGAMRRAINRNLSPIDDIRADAGYRKEAVATLIDAAINKAAIPAKAGR